MNTQRPEWNDANNALVGNGVSMVTLCYLRRFLVYFQDVLAQTGHDEVQVSVELLDCFHRMDATLKEFQSLTSGRISDGQRRAILDGLGQAASDYRQKIYAEDFSGQKSALKLADLQAFIEVTLGHVEHSIAANKRPDGLYHAYNLMTVAPGGGIEITYLPEMLEGQVAVLSSGQLTPSESLAVLDALKASALFREDQYSYILYPNKDLPRFLDKNNVDAAAVQGSKLLSTLVAAGNGDIVTQDCTADSTSTATSTTSRRFAQRWRPCLLSTSHLWPLSRSRLKPSTKASSTTRPSPAAPAPSSDTRARLDLLAHGFQAPPAVYEVLETAVAQSEPADIVGRLFDHYFEINAGIGAHKSPNSTAPSRPTPIRTPRAARAPSARADRTGQGRPALPLRRTGRAGDQRPAPLTAP